MTLHYRIDAEDVGALSDWFYTGSDLGKKNLRRSVVSTSVVLSVICLLSAIAMPRAVPIAVVEWIVCMMLCTLFLPKRLLASQRKLSIKLYENSGNLFGAKTVEVNEEGVIALSEHTTTLYRWPAVQNIVTTPTHLLLLVGPIQAVIIARDKVQEGDFNAFVAEAKRLRAQAADTPLPRAIPAR